MLLFRYLGTIKKLRNNFGTAVGNTIALFNYSFMIDSGVEKEKSSKKKLHKYFSCERCGYISIIRNSNCPICIKDGKKIKMK